MVYRTKTLFKLWLKAAIQPAGNTAWALAEATYPCIYNQGHLIVYMHDNPIDHESLSEIIHVIKTLDDIC